MPLKIVNANDVEELHWSSPGGRVDGGFERYVV